MRRRATKMVHRNIIPTKVSIGRYDRKFPRYKMHGEAIRTAVTVLPELQPRLPFILASYINLGVTRNIKLYYNIILGQMKIHYFYEKLTVRRNGHLVKYEEKFVKLKFFFLNIGRLILTL